MLRGRSNPDCAKPLREFLQDLVEGSEGTRTAISDRAEQLEQRLVSHTNALSLCDSISIDPHKLGYIPYPAGAILFKQRDVRELIKYEAPYLNAAQRNTADAISSEPDASSGHSILPERNVGIPSEEIVKRRIPWYEGEMSSYTLEGSRPGASAASVYLAHRTVPLDQEGHGGGVGQTILGTWKLVDRLQANLQLDQSNDSFGVAFLNPDPDLNIVCYNFHGMCRYQGSQAPKPLPLYVVNELVRRLYQEYLPTSAHPMATREFVIAKTALPFEKYGENLSKIWSRLSEQVGIPSPVGRFMSKGDLLTNGNPWRDDSEIVLVRTAIMGIFFLTARTTHHGKQIDLVDHYAATVKDSLFKIAGEILNSPLPPERRPQLRSPVIIVEDSPRELEALQSQFTSEKSIDFKPKYGDLLRDAGERQDAINKARDIKATGALVDVSLDEDRTGGIEFLRTMANEPWFHGGVLFTSQKLENSAELQNLKEVFQTAGKKLYFHEKPSIDSRYYQARVNLVLADLWDILTWQP